MSAAASVLVGLSAGDFVEVAPVSGERGGVVVRLHDPLVGLRRVLSADAHSVLVEHGSCGAVVPLSRIVRRIDGREQARVAQLETEHRLLTDQVAALARTAEELDTLVREREQRIVELELRLARVARIITEP